MDQPIQGLAYDSRAVKPRDLFFALPGAKTDGHDFISQAMARGAAASIVERKVSLPEAATWVRVASVRRVMGLCAAKFFAYPSRQMVLVGVTGTNGKTTTTYLLESIFSAAGLVTGVIGTINYRYRDRLLPAHHTTPESVELQAILAEMAASAVQGVAMEVSSHALELERVRGMEFDVALFTNLSRDHLDFHVDMERYFAAKTKLFTDYLTASPKKKKFAVIHGEDPRGKELLRRSRQAGIEVLSYGKGRQWDVYPMEAQDGLEGLKGKIRLKDQTMAFSSHLIGSANLENILGAAAVGLVLGLSPEVIAKGLGQLKAVPGRLEKIGNDLGISVLIDYAHTPDALERMLGALRPLTAGRLIALFGCGGDRDRGKRPLMGEIGARLSDLLVLTSDNPRSEDPARIIEEIEAGVEKTKLKQFSTSDFRFSISNPKSGRGYFVEPDRRAAIRLALRLADRGDLVLIAGKGHEDYQILGSERIHFDDREVAREELGRRAGT